MGNKYIPDSMTKSERSKRADHGVFVPLTWEERINIFGGKCSVRSAGHDDPDTKCCDQWGPTIYGWTEPVSNCFLIKVDGAGPEIISFYRGSLTTRADWEKAPRRHQYFHKGGDAGFCPEHQDSPGFARSDGKYCIRKPNKIRCAEWTGYVADMNCSWKAARTRMKGA